MLQPLPPNFYIASSRRFGWAIATRRGLTATAARRGLLGKIQADAEQMLGGTCVADLVYLQLSAAKQRHVHVRPLKPTDKIM